MNAKDILSLLGDVRHPAHEDKSIVDLGMVKKVDVSEGKVIVTLVFPRKRDPLAEYIIGSTRATVIRALGQGIEVEVKTEVAEEAPASKKTLDLDDSRIKKVRHIIGIASGKGGVGKSTVAVNLAVALSRLGLVTGLADADVYGPSVPIMTGTEGAKPLSYTDEDGRDWIQPIEKFGVSWMSIGYFAERGQALIWRGPMASNALKQLILQVDWGDLDVLLIDMPPGTGDIHISLVKDIPMEAAIIVTTPQNVALSDVEKGVAMFRNDGVRKPILGLIENMSWFTPAELPDHRYYIFGRDGGARMAEELDLDLLGQIPLVQGIRESGDNGEPVALGSGPDALAYLDIARNMAARLG